MNMTTNKKTAGFLEPGVNIVFQSAPDSNRLFELEVKPQNAAASGVRSDIWEPSDPTVRRSHQASLRHLTEVLESENDGKPLSYDTGAWSSGTVLILRVDANFAQNSRSVETFLSLQARCENFDLDLA